MHSATLDMLQGFLAAFNRHDLDAVMGYFHDDCSFDFPRGPHPWGNRAVGKDEVRALLATRFAGIPDVSYTGDEHWMLGEHAVSRWRLRGTTVAGKKIDVHGCDLLDLKDGKIARKDSYWKIVE